MPRSIGSYHKCARAAINRNAFPQQVLKHPLDHRAVGTQSPGISCIINPARNTKTKIKVHTLAKEGGLQ
jgi:hypothetical protein